MTRTISPSDALLELAERCEAAAGPDWELAHSIALEIGWEEMPMDWRMKRDWRGPQGQICSLFPRFDSSVDAALTLVPEGWDYSVQTSHNRRNARAMCDLQQEAPFKPEEWLCKTARAATPALAICAASLRARATQ